MNPPSALERAEGAASGPRAEAMSPLPTAPQDFGYTVPKLVEKLKREMPSSFQAKAFLRCLLSAGVFCAVFFSSCGSCQVRQGAFPPNSSTSRKEEARGKKASAPTLGRSAMDRSPKQQH
eukprot:scaffold803_cov310-Pinguiococcus_pyrenoidosus.AAC.170